MRKSVSAFAAIALAFGVSVAGFTPAVAAPSQTIGDAFDLWNYVLTIKGSQLQSSMGAAAQAAWTPQIAAQAAQSAAYSSVGQINGVVPIERMAEVIPLDKPVNPVGAGQKLGPIRLPVFPVKEFFKVTPGGIGGVGMAATAFAFRGDMANGVLGWFGVDGDGNVCANEVFGQPGSFLNFITGQDCELWQQQQDFLANEGIQPGATLTVCSIAYPTKCITFTGDTSYAIGTGNRITVWCMSGNGKPTDFPSLSANTNRHTGLSVQLQNRDTINIMPTGRCGSVAGTGEGGLWVAGANPPGGNATTHPPDTLLGLKVGSQPVVPVTQLDSDPDRNLVCYITGSDGVERSATSATFKESDGAWPEPNCPVLPAGVYPVSTRIVETGGGQSNTLYEADADEGYLDWQENEAEHCTNRDCVLDLIYVPTGLSCFGMGDACNGWMQSPTRDTDYRCEYGGRAQHVSECFAYAQLFDPVKRLDGRPYSDPRTGDEIGTTTGLRYDEQLMGRPGQNPMMKRACGGSGTFSMNPLDFVLRPVQCALEWAFVPRPAIVEGYGNLVQNKLSTRAPGQIATVVSGWSIAPVMTGCSISYQHWTTGQTMTLVDACPGSVMAPIATISRLVSIAAMIVLAVSLLRRQVSGVVDFKGN